jgi:hypothetical protein
VLSVASPRLIFSSNLFTQVVGDVGKQILAVSSVSLFVIMPQTSLLQEISLERTQPGLPRAMYQGHGRVQDLVSQAQQRSAEVQYGAPSIPTFDPGHQFSASNFSYQPSMHDGPSNPNDPSLISSPAHDSYTQNNAPRTTLDDFGVNLRHSTLGSPQGSSAAGGRFATFPVRPVAGANDFTSQGYSLRDEPPLLSRENPDDAQSFACSVAAALNYAEEPTAPASSPGFSQEERRDEPPRRSLGDAAPPYEMHTSHPSPQALPPGATLANPWGQETVNQNSNASDAEENSGGLAYLGHDGEDEDTRMSQHIRFSGTDQQKDASRSPDQQDFHQRVSEGDSRLPPPRFSASPADEERQLNAAAAREIGREMDNFHQGIPPLHSLPVDRELDAASSPSIDRGRFSAPVSPLAPPNKPFADRAVSPGTTPDVPQSPGGSLNRDSYISYEAPTPRSPSTYGQPAPSFPTQSNSTSPYPTSSYLTSNNTPYGTPLEYPRSPMAKSTSSLTAPPAGTRTISAAAFRRPQARHTSFGSDAVTSPGSTGDSGPRKLLPSAMDSQVPVSQSTAERQDYIGAYEQRAEGDSPGSPRLQDYGALGNMRVANAPDQQSSAPGYGEGRFATNLDGGHY